MTEGRPGRARPHPGGGGRARPRPGDRRRPRAGQPDLARRDPGPGPRHPAGRVGRPRRAGRARGHHGRPRRQHRRAARRPLAGAAGRVPATRGRARPAPRPRARARRAARGHPRRHGRSRWLANLGSVADARAALAAGADGAGLVRTEFLFLGRGAAPDVDEQQAEYDAIAEALAGGGSRCAPSTSAATSRCPTCRCPSRTTRSSDGAGIRLSLDHRDLLRDQLVAICRTARALTDQRDVPDGLDARRAASRRARCSPTPPGRRAPRTACGSA